MPRAGVGLAALLAAWCCGGAPRPAAAGCVFEDGIDFSAGKEAQPAGWPKKTPSKEECCAACAAEQGCAAGVFLIQTDAECWYKTAEDVAKKGKAAAGHNTVGCTLSAGGGGGGHFLLLLCGAAAVYVGGGMALGHAQGKRPRDGITQLHPHAHLWREWRGLIADGLSFSGGGGAGSRGGAAGKYSQVGDARPEDGGSRGRSRKKEKKRGRDRKPEKAAASPPQPAAEPALEAELTAEPAREWKPTARAAHLSSGARETGVKIQM